MAGTSGIGSAGEGTAIRSRSRLGRVLREPMFHFVLFAVLLLAARNWWPSDGSGGEIVVSEAVVAGLRADHLRRTGRLPSPDQEEALIQGYVDEEVLYREALALGLDRGDLIVRRRLMQKMTFLLEGAEPIRDPTDEDLRRFLESGAERYTIPERVSLRHVFVSSERQRGQTLQTARGLRRQLASGADPADLGDPFLRGRELNLRSRTELASIFGPAFAQSVMELPQGAWSEPVASGFGYHLVFVSERRPLRLPALDEVRDALLRDWRKQQRDEANRRAKAKLRERYEVRLQEAPVPAS